jgi:hypothetical protein
VQSVQAQEQHRVLVQQQVRAYGVREAPPYVDAFIQYGMLRGSSRLGLVRQVWPSGCCKGRGGVGGSGSCAWLESRAA